MSEYFAPSISRVSFNQHSAGGVTASLRHTSGPLTVGERIVVFEVDELTIWGWGTVSSFDRDRGVAELTVDWDSLVELTPTAAPRGAAGNIESAHGEVVAQVRQLATVG